MRLAFLIGVITCFLTCSNAGRRGDGSCDEIHPSYQEVLNGRKHFYQWFVKMMIAENSATDNFGNVILSPTVSATVMAIKTTEGVEHSYINEQKRMHLGVPSFANPAREEINHLLRWFEESGLNVNVATFRETELTTPLGDWADEIVAKEFRIRAQIVKWYKQMTGASSFESVGSRDVCQYAYSLSQSAFPLYASIVNFNAQFVRPFGSRDTYEEPFLLIEGGFMNVPTMRQRGEFHHGSLPRLNSRVLAIPVKSGKRDTIVYFVVPNTVEDFELLKTNFHTITVEELDDASREHIPHYNIRYVPKKIDVYLPKFVISDIQDHDFKIPAASEDYAGHQSMLEFGPCMQQVSLGMSEKGFGISIPTVSSSHRAMSNPSGSRGSALPVYTKSDEFRVNRPFAVVIGNDDEVVPLISAIVTHPQLRNPMEPTEDDTCPISV